MATDYNKDTLLKRKAKFHIVVEGLSLTETAGILKVRKCDMIDWTRKYGWDKLIAENLSQPISNSLIDFKNWLMQNNPDKMNEFNESFVMFFLAIHKNEHVHRNN